MPRKIFEVLVELVEQSSTEHLNSIEPFSSCFIRAHFSMATPAHFELYDHSCSSSARTASPSHCASQDSLLPFDADAIAAVDDQTHSPQLCPAQSAGSTMRHHATVLQGRRARSPPRFEEEEETASQSEPETAVTAHAAVTASGDCSSSGCTYHPDDLHLCLFE